VLEMGIEAKTSIDIFGNSVVLINYLKYIGNERDTTTVGVNSLTGYLALPYGRLT
jgi:hypothetical protein